MSRQNPVEQWENVLTEAGELTPEVVERIARIHGDRGLRAIDAVAERRVKGYRDFTIVVGRTEEYVVEGGGCQCKDSQYNLDPDDPTDLCWHVIAVRIAEAIDVVEEHDEWYSDMREFL